MTPLSAIDVNFIVLEYNENSVLIKPYSNLFKYDIESYPAFNLDLHTIDTSQDISLQIATRFKSYILNVVRKEEMQISGELENWLSSNLKQTISYKNSDELIPTSVVAVNMKTQEQILSESQKRLNLVMDDLENGKTVLKNARQNIDFVA